LQADLIVTNARILTMDEGNPAAEAMACSRSTGKFRRTPAQRWMSSARSV